MRTVDTVVLIVDAKEGPMPQTRFVLKKALEQNLRPILFINKIDKKDQRAEDVVNMTFDLFMELNASDEQLDFPIVYGIARDGKAGLDPNGDMEDVSPLLEVILNQVKPYEGSESDPLQMQICQLDYDSFIGRLGIGRVTKGMIKNGQTVALAKNGSDKVENFRITKLFVQEGIQRKRLQIRLPSGSDPALRAILRREVHHRTLLPLSERKRRSGGSHYQDRTGRFGKRAPA